MRALTAKATPPATTDEARARDADYVRVHLRSGGWVEGHRRSTARIDERVLLLDPVTVGHPDGSARPPRASDGFVAACDTERIEVLTAPDHRIDRSPRVTGVR